MKKYFDFSCAEESEKKTIAIIFYALFFEKAPVKCKKGKSFSEKIKKIRRVQKQVEKLKDMIKHISRHF